MTGAETHAAFARSWRRCWRASGARGDGEPLMQRLLAAWAEPHRRYHTLQHLDECLATVEPHLGLAQHPAEVELALWFHDAIYEVARKDSEERSAAWAAQVLHDAGVETTAVERVRALILATRHDAVPVGTDEQLVVDVDLAILGTPRERFDEYERQVRDEYRWVPGFLFRRKRREVLAEFLARDPLYATAPIRAALESRARENLTHALQRIGGSAITRDGDA